MSIFLENFSAYTSPQITEYNNKDWIAYGEDNDYFNYLVSLYLKSTSNNAIINGVTNFIYGRGLNALNADKKPEQYAQMMTLFRKSDLRKFIKDFKILGMAAWQVSYSKGQVVKVSHFPMECLRAEKANDKGEVEAWFYSSDWTKLRPNELPEKITAFGYGNRSGNEIYVLKPYTTGQYYYSPPDYVGALPYAMLENEIGDYLINDTLNGFSGTKVVNFNNGVPDQEKMQMIKNDVMSKLTSARGEKVIVAFNANLESKTTVDDIPLNDAPQHYEYLSNECFRKLIVGHRLTSPMLVGIRDGNNSLGNNAEEIETATLLLDNVVIKCYQDEIIDAMDQILAINDISLELYFKTLRPLAFNDIDQLEGVDDDIVEEETGVELSENTGTMTTELGEAMLQHLQGEQIDDEYEEVHARDCSDDNVSIEEWANASLTEIEPEASTLSKIKTMLAPWSDTAPRVNRSDEITANPDGFSYLDSKNYKVRYRYFQQSHAGSIQPDKKGSQDYETRDFCQNMMQLSRNKVVYRIEDIDRASAEGVNGQFGHTEDGYNLFKWAGGCYCRHAWKEVLYRRKKYALPSENLENYKRTGYIPSSYRKNPWGTEESKIAPFNAPDGNHGSLKYKYPRDNG